MGLLFFRKVRIPSTGGRKMPKQKTQSSETCQSFNSLGGEFRNLFPALQQQVKPTLFQAFVCLFVYLYPAFLPRWDSRQLTAFKNTIGKYKAIKLANGKTQLKYMRNTLGTSIKVYCPSPEDLREVHKIK